jgi:hypothetical protein
MAKELSSCAVVQENGWLNFKPASNSSNVVNRDSKKFAADEAALEEVRRQSNREFEENLAAARREASRSTGANHLQVPQAPAQSSLPDPSPPVSCFTTRLGGGVSATSCR